MKRPDLVPAIEDRDALLDWFRRNRARSRALFDLLAPDAYYCQPIALRHPIVFYEGHLAAFNLNTLVKRALDRPGVDARLEALFARGIDPDSPDAAAGAAASWPSREEVRGFVEACDLLVQRALLDASLDVPGNPMLEGGLAVYTILEHEAMHQETMLYMWHQLPYELKRQPADARPPEQGRRPDRSRVRVPAGDVLLGVAPGSVPFSWDNERPAVRVHVDAFEIDRHDVTNGDFLAFVESGAYGDPRWWTPDAFRWIREEQVAHPRFWRRHEGRWQWRGLFEAIDLPESWPVYVSQAEASAYARWAGARLPTESEFHRAAFGTPGGHERQYPWGDEPPDAHRANLDFLGWDPTPAGTHASGRSAWGVEDLVGNGWEWTSTVFGPFEGFSPIPTYPEYSADFFDGQHFVMKGASPATARELVRPSFRNWFRPHYPYVYATFRCAR